MGSGKLQLSTQQQEIRQMTNPYVLEDYLATKSEKQVIKLINTRVLQIRNYLDLVMKYDLPLEMYSTTRRNEIKKATKLAELAEYWLQAAVWSFSQELWDKMITEAGSCLECHGYEALTEC